MHVGTPTVPRQFRRSWPRVRFAPLSCADPARLRIWARAPSGPSLPRQSTPACSSQFGRVRRDDRARRPASVETGRRWGPPAPPLGGALRPVVKPVAMTSAAAACRARCVAGPPQVAQRRGVLLSVAGPAPLAAATLADSSPSVRSPVAPLHDAPAGATLGFARSRTGTPQELAVSSRSACADRGGLPLAPLRRRRVRSRRRPRRLRLARRRPTRSSADADPCRAARLF